MASDFSLSFQVKPSEIDANGHVNNVEYLRWMQEAAIGHADESGCTATTKAAGASWVVRSHYVQYLRPAYLDDDIVVETWVANIRKVSSLRKYRIRQAQSDTVLALGETEWVFVEAATGKPRAIPSEVAICLPPREDDSGSEKSR